MYVKKNNDGSENNPEFKTKLEITKDIFKMGTDNFNIVGKTVVSWHSSQGPDSYLISLR